MEDPLDRVFVDDRVPQRHPDVSKADAKAAWENCIASKPRLHKNPNEYIAIGIDDKGRFIELVAIRNSEGDWLIYHAQTPPQQRAKRELGIGR